MALKDIKAKIQATNRMHKVTRAMEAVSAVKMRKTQTSRARRPGPTRARPWPSFRAWPARSHVSRHPLAQERGGTKLALVVITSDKGLAGALNSGVIKRAVEALENRAASDVSIFAYGRKGEEYFARRGYTIARSSENKNDEVPLSVMEEYARELSRGFVAGEYDKVVAVYSHFKSTFEQVPTVRQLLQLSLPRTCRD